MLNARLSRLVKKTSSIKAKQQLEKKKRLLSTYRIVASSSRYRRDASRRYSSATAKHEEEHSKSNHTENQDSAPSPPLKNSSKPVNSTMLPLAVLGGASAVAFYYFLSRPKKIERTTRKDQILRLRNIFNKYASVTNEVGDKFMTRSDFIASISMSKLSPEDQRLITHSLSKESTFEKLFPADTAHITFNEFVFFDSLLITPEHDLRTAFQMFDSDNDGKMTKDEFIRLMSAIAHVKLSFDSDYWKSYFGENGDGTISQENFLDFLKDLRGGLQKQEFAQFDRKGRGYISGKSFTDVILTNTKILSLPLHTQTNLRNISHTYLDAAITFEDYQNFFRFLDNFDSIAPALKKAKAGVGRRGVSRSDFRRISKITTGVDFSPAELDILYHIFDNPNKHGMLDVTTFITVMRNLQSRRIFDVHQLDKAVHIRTPLEQFIVAVKSFGIGAIAGAIGATAVYPIDLVKTRMQNQRYSTIAGKSTGKQLYTSSFDCFRKVIKNEGPFGLYRGLVPQLIGVAPEKAIKLVVNDVLRDLLKNPETGDVGFNAQIIAGGSAGASQVVFTNPIEIIKIRLQVQGELAALHGVKPKGAITIISELGFTGLYKGASACFMRDIPFSAIYFPAYTFFKQIRKPNPNDLTPWDLFVAGSAAGFFAASTTTPADVIKTRLQVEARKGDQTYNGIVDCFWKILRSEGPLAFFKGVVPRIFRSSPQFGVTLLAYELIQKFFDTEGKEPKKPVKLEDLPETPTTGSWGLTPI
eukprot:TRINITY_DN447_c0_g1_i1.p1 TRINITY_DN447_c0_g1~~TRINITY_DN447_c0_g1_i1.p1  ORF type:complete len:754 (-),score=137.12 TRINITY_DN447_c0_g1_i1:52-2313(-)